MSSPSTATNVIEGLLEQTNEVSRTIQSYSDNVIGTPRQTMSIIESLSSLHKVLGQLIESPFFQLLFTGESNLDQTSIFSMAVNRCGQELHEFLVQWAEVIKRGPRDEENWSLINTTVQRVTETISVYTEAFQSCLTVHGRTLMFKTPPDFSIILNCESDTSRKIKEMTGMFPLMSNPLRDDLLNSTQASVFVQLMSRITNSPVEIQEISYELISAISDASIRIRDVRNRVFTYEQSFDDDNTSQILHWLSRFQTKIQHSELRAIRLPEIGEWFLHQAHFQSWCHDDKSNNIFWCDGTPGAGKSVITSLVVDYLLSSFTDDREGVAYIYCDPNDLCQQTPAMMLAELLAQLLDSRKALPRPVLQLFERYDSGKCSPQVEDLETTLLIVCKKFRKLFFVVDGLDECVAAQHWSSLQALLKRLKTTSARLFVTSRSNREDISSVLDHPTRFTITAHERDVRRYLILTVQQDDNFAKLIDGSLKSKIVCKITQSSQGTFLRPALQIQSLMLHATPADAELALTRMSLDTSRLFEDILEDIKRQSTDRSNLAMKTLTWLAHAKRPMLVKELCQALTISPGDSCPKDINLVQPKLILDFCLGLVVVDHTSTVISLRHPSIREFLRHQSDIQGYTNDYYLASTCLTYLLFDHFADNCNFNGEEMAIQLQLFPFLKYAAQYWGYHAQGHPKGEYKDLIVRFLDDRRQLRCPAQTWFNFEARRVPRNESSRKGATGLQIASSFGLHQTVELLLDRGSEIDRKDSSGWTALHYAAVNGHEATTKVLLERGADADVQDTYGWTALHRASEAGQARLVNILLRYGANPHAQDYCLWTPLPYAAERGHEEVIRLLLGKGASTNSQDKDGRTSLHGSAQAGHVEVVRLLLDNGADGAGKDQRGRSTLHWAATEGREAIVRLVLERGASANDQDQDGWTALHRAAENGHEAVVIVLLDAGSAATTQDNEGWTALHWAAAEGHDSIVGLLLEEGQANVEMQTNKGWTAMQLAAADGHEGIVLQILKHGVNIESQQQDGWTALHCSAAEGHKSVVLALLNYGADVKTKDRRGVTPLLLAAKNGHEEVAKTLMKKGLEENAAGSLGLMAPLEAAMTRQWETLRVLDLISRNTQIASSVDRYQQEPEILYRAQWPE